MNSKQRIVAESIARKLGGTLAPEGAEPPAGSALAHLRALAAAVERGQITEDDLHASLRRRFEDQLQAHEGPGRER